MAVEIHRFISETYSESAFHQLKHMNTGFDDLKVAISIWKTKNVQVNQKGLKMPNCIIG